MLSQIIGRTLCLFGDHDWEVSGNLDNISEKENPGERVVIHWKALFPVTWECQRCGEVSELGFNHVQAVEPNNHGPW